MTPAEPPDPGGLPRRDFLRIAGAGAGLLATGAAGACLPGPPGEPGLWPGPDNPPPDDADAPRVVVIGAGSFGAWSALFLRQTGARVTLVDKYGPANSRATSGGETRGVRSSYGDRPHGPLWAAWATEAMGRWKRWDEEWGREHLLPRVYFTTSDLIFRPEWDNYLERTRAAWDALSVAYEVLDPAEVHRRHPGVFDLDGIGAVLAEPGAGVVRARRAIEGVAEVYRRKGGELVLGVAGLGRREGGRLRDVALRDGRRLEADLFVFALGPWFPQVFPEVMDGRLRIPIGHVVYLGTPPGDERFRHPNLPSYSFPGVTGWPALPPDHRGFRVRTGGRPPGNPDDTVRHLLPEHLEEPLAFVAERFPDLVDAPVVESRACHYELSVSRNFIIDRHPGYENVWFAGGGSAEGFKFGPRVGEYVARRVLGRLDRPELAEAFRLREEEFEEVGGSPSGR